MKKIKFYWENHPLLSYEIDFKPGSKEFFETYDNIRQEVEKYCMNIFDFSSYKNKKILDVGCGNGWLLNNYTVCGAHVTGIDLTQTGVQISKARFRQNGNHGTFLCGNAETLPFKSNCFDMVSSLGVIHHAPKTDMCAREIIRVVRPGGKVIVCVYYRNFFLRKSFYSFLKGGMRLFGMHRSDSDLQGIKNRIVGEPEEFVRNYDGPGNPLGKCFSRREVLTMFKGLENIQTELHYFPTRFIPGIRSICLPDFINRVLDRYFGIMLYITGNKPYED